MTRAKPPAKPKASKAEAKAKTKITTETANSAPNLPLGKSIGGKAAGGKAMSRAAIVMRPHFRRERALMKQGTWPVAGCDEVGRGPLAGPVVAAAVVLDPDRIPKGIDDSKRLTRAERERLFDHICTTALV